MSAAGPSLEEPHNREEEKDARGGGPARRFQIHRSNSEVARNVPSSESMGELSFTEAAPQSIPPSDERMAKREELRHEDFKLEVVKEEEAPPGEEEEKVMVAAAPSPAVAEVVVDQAH